MEFKPDEIKLRKLVTQLEMSDFTNKVSVGDFYRLLKALNLVFDTPKELDYKPNFYWKDQCHSERLRIKKWLDYKWQNIAPNSGAGRLIKELISELQINDQQ